MNILIDYTKQLNLLLVNPQADLQPLETMLCELKRKHLVNFLFVDFTYYTQERLSYAQEEKIKCVEDLRFEPAVSFRDLELKCQKYTNYRMQNNLTKSKFLQEDNTLIYLHLGLNNVEDHAAAIFCRIKQYG